MKTPTVAAVLAVFALTPMIGAACEYESAASAAPADQLGMAPAPGASRLPVTSIAKAPARKTTKSVVTRVTVPVAATKVASASTN